MRSFKTTWKHIRRSPYQAMAAILLMMVTFLALTIFSFIIIGSSKVINYFETAPQVIGFFKDEASQENVTALQEQVKATGKVASMKYVTKKEAVQIYLKQNENEPLLQELVSEDYLPASLEVSANTLEDLRVIAGIMENSPYIDKVTYLEDVVQELNQWFGGVRNLGLLITIILALVSVLTMATIIGFKISQKREEIEIMRLLSATKWYVRWPFIVEGVFYGVIGAVFGWLIATAGLLYATPYLETFLDDIPLLPVSFMFLLGLLGFEILIAIILGAYASFLAVLRYLK